MRDRLETRAENDIIWRQTRKRSQLWLIGVGRPFTIVKFIYSEKATKFWEISTLDLSYVVPVKPTVEISQNFVVFSEYMNFTEQNWIDVLTADWRRYKIVR